jgi:hypothetical protein
LKTQIKIVKGTYGIIVLRASTTTGVVAAAGTAAGMAASTFMTVSVGGAKNTTGSDSTTEAAAEAISWTISVEVVVVEGSIWDTETRVVMGLTRLMGTKADAEDAMARLTTMLENFIFCIVVEWKMVWLDSSYVLENIHNKEMWCWFCFVRTEKCDGLACEKKSIPCIRLLVGPVIFTATISKIRTSQLRPFAYFVLRGPPSIPVLAIDEPLFLQYCRRASHRRSTYAHVTSILTNVCTTCTSPRKGNLCQQRHTMTHPTKKRFCKLSPSENVPDLFFLHRISDSHGQEKAV